MDVLPRSPCGACVPAPPLSLSRGEIRPGLQLPAIVVLLPLLQARPGGGAVHRILSPFVQWTTGEDVGLLR
eukprot:14629932-Alexandrium_andersonii.AAC.1